MKTYVIGSNGFLGSHLSKYFEKDGVVQIAPSYRDTDPTRWHRDVLEGIRKCSPDLVLIPGASQLMGDDEKAIQALIASNCILPCLIAQHLLEHLPAARLVVFGSSWQFADSDSYRPFNLYAASKQAGQDLLTHYALSGLKILQLIMFDTYGEADSRRKLLTVLQDACVKGDDIGTTPGEQEIDLVHIHDICTGVERAVYDLQAWDTSKGVLVQGLGSGQPILVKELITRVSNKFKKELRAKIGERSYRPREVMRVYRSYIRPSEWAPKVSEYQRAITDLERQDEKNAGQIAMHVPNELFND